MLQREYDRGNDFIDKDGKQYINLCSSGATRTEFTQYLILEITDCNYMFRYKEICYDKEKVIKELDFLDVPEKEFIKQAFFGISTN